MIQIFRLYKIKIRILFGLFILCVTDWNYLIKVWITECPLHSVEYTFSIKLQLLVWLGACLGGLFHHFHMEWAWRQGYTSCICLKKEMCALVLTSPSHIDMIFHCCWVAGSKFFACSRYSLRILRGFRLTRGFQGHWECCPSSVKGWLNMNQIIIYLKKYRKLEIWDNTWWTLGKIICLTIFSLV